MICILSSLYCGLQVVVDDDVSRSINDYDVAQRIVADDDDDRKVKVFLMMMLLIDVD